MVEESNKKDIEKQVKKQKKSNAGFYFLGIMLVIYLIVFFINPIIFNSSMKIFYDIFLKVLGMFILVFLLMTLSNYFFTKDKIFKYLGRESKKRSWLLVIGLGILSSGPIYMWYPLIADLKEKGMRIAFVTTFLYNRAIKIPFLPLLLFYFSFKFAIILLIVMILLSVVQGLIIERIMEVKK